MDLQTTTAFAELYLGIKEKGGYEEYLPELEHLIRQKAEIEWPKARVIFKEKSIIIQSGGREKEIKRHHNFLDKQNEVRLISLT